jgi:hypothetical protein
VRGTLGATIPAVSLITADLPARCDQRDHMKSSAQPRFVDLRLFPAESRIEQQRNPLCELCWEQFANARRIKPFRLNDIVA